jgi:hypothetical protein
MIKIRNEEGRKSIKDRKREELKILNKKEYNAPNPSSRVMTLGSTQPLTEMSTRNLPVDKGRPRA